MQYCKSVTLRMRDRRNGTKSLFLDFWPGYRNPETMELIRRRSLGMYIYANPISTQQKKYNEAILAKAEAIRCKVFIEVINEKYDFFNQDRLKEDFLAYFKNIVNRNFAKCDAAYKHFSRFCHNKCTFEMLDTVFCNKYKEYLLDTKVSARGKVMVNKPISRNTASAYWNIFKQVLTKAYRERRLVDNIASLLDNIPCTIPVKQSLSLEEVRKLYNSECSVPVVRKAAIFSCLSGLRISDILNLKWENIQTYADGGHYLDFKCVKTQRQTQVPIGDDAYELIQPQTTEVDMKNAPGHGRNIGAMIGGALLAGLTVMRELGRDHYPPAVFVEHHHAPGPHVYFKGGVDSPQDLASRAFDAGLNAAEHGVGLGHGR